jgi:membrane-bound serine protease (ClpP class)
MAGELFFPTGGLLMLMAAICIGAGVFMTFAYGDSATGLLTLVGVFLAGPALGYAAMQVWPRTSIGRQLVRSGVDDTLAASPAIAELEALRGRVGRASSDLRPSGTATFDGRRVDVLSDGPYIPAGSWVKCTEVRAGQVRVRQVSAPNLDDINLDELPT